MDTTLSRYRQSMRTRRSRSRQGRVARAYEQAIRPAPEDRYLVALDLAPFR